MAKNGFQAKAVNNQIIHKQSQLAGWEGRLPPLLKMKNDKWKM